ncbi:MAG: hypothetical protein HND48_20655 [Chloroflexi bacterium]|nr:hypothetical protein [Chloroflexota bacterium]
MDDSNEQDYMHHAYEALSDGDFNQAQVFFKQAIRVNSANEDAWLGLAKTHAGILSARASATRTCSRLTR